MTYTVCSIESDLWPQIAVFKIWFTSERDEKGFKTDVNGRRRASTVDGLEKCSLVNVNQEKCSGVDVNR